MWPSSRNGRHSDQSGTHRTGPIVSVPTRVPPPSLKFQAMAGAGETHSSSLATCHLGRQSHYPQVPICAVIGQC